MEAFQGQHLARYASGGNTSGPKGMEMVVLLFPAIAIALRYRSSPGQCTIAGAQAVGKSDLVTRDGRQRKSVLDLGEDVLNTGAFTTRSRLLHPRCS